MSRTRLNEDGNPIFYIPDIDFPFDYPAHLPNGLKVRFFYLARQYCELEHLWEVQLRGHRDYWNIRAAYEFWCEKGSKTIHNRRFGWSEQWLIDAMDEVKYDVQRLEDIARHVRDTRARAERLRNLMPTPVGDNHDGDSSTVQLTDSSDETDVEPSPTHRPARRQFQSQQNRRPFAASAGTRDHPIMIVQDSEDEKKSEGQGRKDVTPTRTSRQEDVRIRLRLHEPFNARIDNRSDTPDDGNKPPTGSGYAKENLEIHSAPHTPVRYSRESSSGSASASPTKRRAGSRDGFLGGRAQKSPRRSFSSTPGSKLHPASEHSSPSDGGCPLNLIHEET